MKTPNENQTINKVFLHDTANLESQLIFETTNEETANFITDNINFLLKRNNYKDIFADIFSCPKTSHYFEKDEFNGHKLNERTKLWD